MINLYTGILGYFVIVLIFMLGAIIISRSESSIDAGDFGIIVLACTFWPLGIPVILGIVAIELFKENFTLKSYKDVRAERKAKQAQRWDK